MGSVSQVKIEGTLVRNTRWRAYMDQRPGQTFTVTNLGPASIEHSATRDMGTPTTLAAGASANITGRRWLRSIGKSVLSYDVTTGLIEGIVDDGRAT